MDCFNLNIFFLIINNHNNRFHIFNHYYNITHNITHMVVETTLYNIHVVNARKAIRSENTRKTLGKHSENTRKTDYKQMIIYNYNAKNQNICVFFMIAQIHYNKECYYLQC